MWNQPSRWVWFGRCVSCVMWAFFHHSLYQSPGTLELCATLVWSSLSHRSTIFKTLCTLFDQTFPPTTNLINNEIFSTKHSRNYDLFMARPLAQKRVGLSQLVFGLLIHPGVILHSLKSLLHQWPLLFSTLIEILRKIILVPNLLYANLGNFRLLIASLGFLHI